MVRLAELGLAPEPHYASLHASPAGAWYGRTAGSMRVTQMVVARLIRLPLNERLTESDQTDVVAAIGRVCERAEAAA